MADRTTTIFYNDWLDVLEEFSDEEAGQLLKAVLLFGRNGAEVTFKDRGMRAVYKQMVSSVGRNMESYDEKCEKNRKRIQEYWNKKKIPTNTNEYAGIPTYSMATDSDSDSEPDSDSKSGSGSGSDNDSDYIKQPQPLPELNQDTIFLIKQTWNAQHSTSNILSISPLGTRANNIRLCVNNDLDQFLEAIRSIDQQAFLVSMKEKGKPVTFDWFVKPDNYQKVIEGNYKEDFSEEGEEYGYKFH